MSSIITDKLYLGGDVQGALLYDVNSSEILKKDDLKSTSVWDGGDLLYEKVFDEVHLNSILEGPLEKITLNPIDLESAPEFNYIENLVLKNNQIYVSFANNTNYILSKNLEILSDFRLGIILDVTNEEVPLYYIKNLVGYRRVYSFYLGQKLLVTINKNDLSSDNPVALLITATSGVILLKPGILFF